MNFLESLDTIKKFECMYKDDAEITIPTDIQFAEAVDGLTLLQQSAEIICVRVADLCSNTSFNGRSALPAAVKATLVALGWKEIAGEPGKATPIFVYLGDGKALVKA